MRCRCCDALLTDYDVTVKSEFTGEYLDMCGTCRHATFDDSYLEEVVIQEDDDYTGEEDVLGEN